MYTVLSAIIHSQYRIMTLLDSGLVVIILGMNDGFFSEVKNLVNVSLWSTWVEGVNGCTVG